MWKHPEGYAEWLWFHPLRGKKTECSIGFQREWCNRTHKTHLKQERALRLYKLISQEIWGIFYRLPKATEKRSKWIPAIQWNKWTPGSKTQICSYHFVNMLNFGKIIPCILLLIVIIYCYTLYCYCYILYCQHQLNNYILFCTTGCF